jgi:hypothetical protein
LLQDLRINSRDIYSTNDEYPTRILQEFYSQLERTGKKIEEFRRSWTEHLEWVERCEAELREQNPAPLKVNAWATPNAVLGARRSGSAQGLW